MNNIDPRGKCFNNNIQESCFSFRNVSLSAVSTGLSLTTPSAGAVSCISEASISTTCLIPPLPHLLICNLTAPPPPPLRLHPNSGPVLLLLHDSEPYRVSIWFLIHAFMHGYMFAVFMQACAVSPVFFFFFFLSFSFSDQHLPVSIVLLC